MSIRIFKVILKYYNGESIIDYSYTGMYSCVCDVIDVAQKLFMEKFPNTPHAFYSVMDIGSLGCE